MKKRSIAVFAVTGLLLPVFASAAEFHSGENYGLGKTDTVNGNLYVAGGNLAIEGTVHGDVVAAGGTVNVGGMVERDVLIAGGNVNIGGHVGDDVRVAGGTVVISGVVDGEVVVAGGMVRILRGAIVRGDLAVGSNNVVIEGEVLGRVHRPMHPNFSGDEFRRGIRALLGLFWVLKLLMMLGVGLIFYFFLRRGVRDVLHEARTNYLRELLRGGVLLFVLPIGAIFLAVTVIGIPFALMVGAIYIVGLVLASAFAGAFLGGLILKDGLRQAGEFVNVWSVVLGIIAIAFLRLLPIVGFVACALLFLPVFGSLMNFWYTHALRAWRGGHE